MPSSQWLTETIWSHARHCDHSDIKVRNSHILLNFYTKAIILTNLLSFLFQICSSRSGLKSQSVQEVNALNRRSSSNKNMHRQQDWWNLKDFISDSQWWHWASDPPTSTLTQVLGFHCAWLHLVYVVLGSWTQALMHISQLLCQLSYIYKLLMSF